MTCQHCGSHNRLEAEFCDACGFHMDMPSVETQAGINPVAVPATDTSPSGRRAYLDGLDGRDAPPALDWIGRIADAEEYAAQCEADLDEARDQLSYARHAIRSEHLDERDLDPAARHAYVEYMQAEDRWQRRVQVAERAQSRLNALVAQFDEAAKVPGPAPEDW